MSGAVKAALKTWRVTIKRNCTIERTIEAESYDAAKKHVTDVVGLHDFALCAGGRITADNLIIDMINEVTP